MKIMVTDVRDNATGMGDMGNLVTRLATMGIYRAINSEADRRQVEQFVSSLRSEFAWLKSAEQTLIAWRRSAPNDPNVNQLSALIDDANAALMSINSQVRVAAQAAKDDGYELPGLREQADTGDGLSALPVLIVVPIAIAALVCAYLVFDSAFNAIRQYLTLKTQTTSLVQSGRPDLIPNLNNNDGGGGGSGSSALWVVLGIAAAAGVFVLGSKKRR